MTERVRGNRHQDIVTRFWLHVEKRDGCWEWLGTHVPKGYGRLTHEGKRLRAHRLAWEINNGPIPHGLQVLHRCDNPPCVNPEHLWLGTNADNVRDREEKARRTAPYGSDHPHAKLNEALVIELRARHAAGETCQALADESGVSEATMRLALKGRTWRHV